MPRQEYFLLFSEKMLVFLVLLTYRSHRLMVRTGGFHPPNRSSILRGTAIFLVFFPKYCVFQKKSSKISSYSSNLLLLTNLFVILGAVFFMYDRGVWRG